MTHSCIHVGALSNIRPTVNFANRMTTLPGQAWGPRVIPDCQLLYVISGRATLTLGPEPFELSAGDCVFYGTDSPHMLISAESDPFTFTSIHFCWDHVSPNPVHPGPMIRNCHVRELDKPAAAYVLEVEGFGDVLFPHYLTVPNLESLFMQIVREYRLEEHGYASVLRGLLSQLLVILIRHQIDGHYASSARRKMAPALEAIRKQPHVAWKTADLAQLCGYHPTYFAAVFKETIGHSPKHYLVLERIRKAKELLLEAETVEAVAENLGYTSAHYFCRSFKTVTGLTPSAFRRQSVEL